MICPECSPECDDGLVFVDGPMNFVWWGVVLDSQGKKKKKQWLRLRCTEMTDEHKNAEEVTDTQTDTRHCNLQLQHF
jgi:hypothetical protein